MPKRNIKRQKLMHGDCLSLLDSVHDKSIDLVCADMPYGTTRCSWDSVIKLTPLWKQLKRVTKENAAILLFAQTPFDKVLGASNLSMLRYEWIWEKTLATGFLNAKKMPMKAHENILVFYKKLPTYHPIKTTDRYPRSVVMFPRDKDNIHPTQKPLALIEYLVKTYSNTGDTVLDFCMGSGTTGAACKNLRRSFLGFEKDKKYFDLALQRLTNI